MRRRRIGAPAVVAAACALAGCGASAHSVDGGRGAASPAPSVVASLATTSTTAAVVGPTTAAGPTIPPALLASLERQLSAVTGQLSVANSAIAQADVDAAKADEGSAP